MNVGMGEKRNSLSLAERVILIEYAKKNPGVGMRKIAEVFTYGRTQVQGILKTKESITNSSQHKPLPQESAIEVQSIKM